jgi:hypothetical protein
MAEIKNNFVKSRMNKDLDARLVPPGEYRDAQNVAISKSEGEAVGALENILGNISLTDFNITSVDNIDIIGRYMDVVNERIIVFMTNYIDTSADRLSNVAPLDSLHYIGVYNIKTQIGSLIVSGYFLNFSKANEIYGVNLIDDLLFWTDNRNQPRKINIEKALTDNTYYSNEDHISVAKYYPHKQIDLFKDEVVDWDVWYSGSGTPGNLYVNEVDVRPIGGSGSGLVINIVNLPGWPAPGPGSTTINNSNIELVNAGKGYTDGDVLYIIPRFPNVGDALLKLTVDTISTMQDVVSDFLPDGVTSNPLRQPYNHADASIWPGDPDYLKDKFVRFSYRFKFDDGEYSLIAPFTQECFVPEQDGYFIYEDNTPTKKQDENSTFKSTEVGFMQNKINNIILILNSPIAGGWDQVATDLKISEIDILYKQADQNIIKIIDTIDANVFSSEYTDFLEYEYQSKKPWKTLPTSELLRVYDQVPVRALAQEIGGNRVIYGNYIDKHTPPAKLNYCLDVASKPNEDSNNISGHSIATRKEYQNHTLKRNRTYQVGVVLCDRYGRQSTVILSEQDIPIALELSKGSTIFHPFWEYDDTSSFAEYPGGTLITSTDTWPGDSLQATFFDTITSNKSSITGEPGMYQAEQSVASVAISNPGTHYNSDAYNNLLNLPTTGGTGTGLTVDIVTSPTASNPTGFPVANVFINNPGSGYTVGDIVTIHRQPWYPPACAPGACSFSGPNATLEITSLNTANPLGWYSFKMVVKQPKQDYYNVYFPGILNGYISGESADPTVASATEPVIHFVMHADNVNKIPRDLSLVGPNQLSFRSGRPTPSSDPSYYQFIDSNGNAFAADPFTEEGEKLLKDRDRERDLDSGSQITNASLKLSPRVQNYGGDGGLHPFDWGGVALSYPGTSTDTVTTIGTGVELGLWDPAAKSPYNTAPVFYGYKNNPYIAKVIVGDYTQRINNSVGGEFGATGPSTSATMLRYKLHNVPGLGGNDYVAGSENLRSTPEQLAGSAVVGGKGILWNITKVSTGTTIGSVGTLVASGLHISNPDDREIVGYDAWNYLGPVGPSAANPLYKTHTIHGGDGAGEANVAITSQELFGDMVPGLSIYEVEAIESKLDIYWETSTNGLISELNTRINQGDLYTPTSWTDGVSYPGWAQLESFDTGTAVTSKFWPVDATNTIISGVKSISGFGAGSTVTDAAGIDRSNDFTIVTGDVLDDYSFQIFTANYFMYGGSGGSHFGNTKGNFEINLEIEVPTATYASNGATNILTLPFNVGGNILQNIAPSFVKTFVPAHPGAGSPLAGEPIDDFWRYNPSGVSNRTFFYSNGMWSNYYNDPLTACQTGVYDDNKLWYDTLVYDFGGVNGSFDDGIYPGGSTTNAPLKYEELTLEITNVELTYVNPGSTFGYGYTLTEGAYADALGTTQAQLKSWWYLDPPNVGLGNVTQWKLYCRRLPVSPLNWFGANCNCTAYFFSNFPMQICHGFESSFYRLHGSGFSTNEDPSLSSTINIHSKWKLTITITDGGGTSHSFTTGEITFFGA